MEANAYERLRATDQLPSPTGVALEIIRIASDDESTISAVAATIEKDAAIAARVMKLVHSPWAGTTRKTGRIVEAVKLLGTRVVISVALGFSLLSRYRKGLCAAFEYEAHWSESLAGAVAARHIASRFGRRLPDTAYACRLLSKLGRLAFATARPNEYADVLNAVDQNDLAALAEAERKSFQIDHNGLAAEMMRDWSLPEVFSDATRRQDSFEAVDSHNGSLVDQLAWTLHLSTIVARGLIRQARLEDLAMDVCCRGIEPNEFPQLVRTIALEWRDAASVFSLPASPAPDHEVLYSAANRHLAAAYQEMHREAHTDQLTGLSNRRSADARLKEYWAASVRNGGALACVMLDIDRFKEINDRYGHAAGDQVLQETARLLRDTVRADEPVFRIGGEEFLIICPNSTATQAETLAQRIRVAIAKRATAGKGGAIRVTISGGIAGRGAAMAGPLDLIDAADAALYIAKRAGRNRVQVATDKQPTVLKGIEVIRTGHQ